MVNSVSENVPASNEVELKFPQRGDAAGALSPILRHTNPRSGFTAFYDETDELRVLRINQINEQLGPNALVLIKRFYELCKTDGDIRFHLNALTALALECSHITEMGTRGGQSTTALLLGRPDTLICYDLAFGPTAQALLTLQTPTDLQMQIGNTRILDIAETDLLFIDTLHIYEQLKIELERHAPKARRYIVLHDTVTCGIRWFDSRVEGARVWVKGLRPAVFEFLRNHPEWVIVDERLHNNGLMILGRR